MSRRRNRPQSRLRPRESAEMLSRRSLLRVVLSGACASVSLSAARHSWPAASRNGSNDKEAERDHALTQRRPSDVESLVDAVVFKHENLFFLTNPAGAVPMTGPHGLGLYYRDCRFLNGYEVRLGGVSPTPLASITEAGAIGIFELTNQTYRTSTGQTVKKEEISLAWHRTLDSHRLALYDTLAFQNFALGAVEVPVALSFSSGFEDLFAVRGLITKRFGTLHPSRWEDGLLRFHYAGKDGIHRRLLIAFSEKPDEQGRAEARFRFTLSPQETKTVTISLVVEEGRTLSQPSIHVMTATPRLELERELRRQSEDWMAQLAHVSSDDETLNAVLTRSFEDLRLLRMHRQQESFFAAGIPWFATLFGRDSLITALEILAYQPSFAEETVRLLAKYQGNTEDAWRDEQPGKILHEIRVGEMANLNEIPHTPFYGTVDATPLFLILIAQHAAWTGSLRVFEELRSHVERALDWMNTYGDRHGEDYVWYHSRAEDGLVNKGWKDSGDAIVNADGSLATPPIALAEVQGYAWLARRSLADLYQRAGERGQAEQLRTEAARLQQRFQGEFWLPDSHVYALALQKDKKPVAVASSNAGQTLWGGIAATEHARHLVPRLMTPDMFSGYGVRTLSTEEVGYNPISYHRGTVWPHDNALIGVGCRNYGEDDAALKIFEGLIAAASYFRSRQLPEVFCGFSRHKHGRPIEYPVACHPQAWAAGSVPYLLTHLLGLDPDGFTRELRITKPVLPRSVTHLELRSLHVGNAIVDLRFRRRDAKVEVEVVNKRGGVNVTVKNAP